MQLHACKAMDRTLGKFTSIAPLVQSLCAKLEDLQRQLPGGAAGVDGIIQGGVHLKKLYQKLLEGKGTHFDNIPMYYDCIPGEAFPTP